jgi:hypothetical protein
MVGWSGANTLAIIADATITNAKFNAAAPTSPSAKKYAKTKVLGII